MLQTLTAPFFFKILSPSREKGAHPTLSPTSSSHSVKNSTIAPSSSLTVFQTSLKVQDFLFLNNYVSLKEGKKEGFLLHNLNNLQLMVPQTKMLLILWLKYLQEWMKVFVGWISSMSIWENNLGSLDKMWQDILQGWISMMLSLGRKTLSYEPWLDSTMFFIFWCLNFIISSTLF